MSLCQRRDTHGIAVEFPVLTEAGQRQLFRLYGYDDRCLFCAAVSIVPLLPSDIFTSVREELLGEAQRSPGLLADLANLERYIAESYSARSFIELLQNADDAEATRFLVTRHGEWLICANDGRAFSRQDFYSLCRSASSAKQRGQTIGYRGIGFKSVVGVASSVHLLSGELRTTFSRELTRACLGSDTPSPLVRIPHPIALDQNNSIFATIQKLEQAGYSTVFVLGGLDAERVQDEFDQFDADYLLFLRHISEATLDGPHPRSYRCKRKSLDVNAREVSIGGPDRHASWRIVHVGSCDIAYSLVDGQPVPLNAASAIAHAFLPTLESTGFGIRINADFSTDPSRTRIIFDDATLSCIDDAAEAVAGTISNNLLAQDGDNNLLACLTPTADLATIALQKRSFRTELIARVKKRLDHLKEQVTLAPSWLNAPDAQNLAASLKCKVLEAPTAQCEAQTNFMRYLGVKMLTAESVAKAAETMPLSPKGCADLVSLCVRNVASGINLRQLVDKPIWRATGSPAPTNLAALASTKAALDENVIAAINASGVTSTELGRMLKTAGMRDESIGVLLPGVVLSSLTAAPSPVVSPDLDKSPSENDLPQPAFDPLLPTVTARSIQAKTANVITSRSLPAWRSAEQYVAAMLSEHGYQVEDRSRQNLGYDLYAEKDARKYYVEVKLLDYAGQPFIITSNEEVVARECGESYIIALTLRGTDSNVHIRYVHDPARTMKFVRQCRQWVWECSDYEFKSSQ